MKQEQIEVRELMQKMGQATPEKPTMPSLEIRKLRVKLIAEELGELALAYGIDLFISDGEVEVFAFSHSRADLIAAADATTDLRVVVIGTDIAMGIDGEPCWNEVHRSNMSKDGSLPLVDGKFQKGASYSPPNLAPILEAQSR